MTMIRTIAALSLLALATPALAAAPKGNVAAGQEKSKTCAACHGPTGNESLDPTYPKLAGQYPEYLAKALRDYKSGERQNAVMAGFAGALSEEDIDDLSAYFAAQEGDIHDLSKVDER
ncbi:cytochrome c [bacterium BD-1]|uniref:c-type cytochrome n=1 Tax=Arenimonas sp. TaxID=1872635 RepID=UPI001E64DE85|nr:cytochrome c [Ottowia caeni]